MDKLKTPEIPFSEYKSVIINEWYPTKPEYLVRDAFRDIHEKFSTNKHSWHLSSYEICELFRTSGFGKPKIFSVEDYNQYLETYGKDSE
jgi:hypothetical protein